MPVLNVFGYPTVPLVKQGADQLRDLGPKVLVDCHVPAARAQALAAAKTPVPGPISGPALIDTGASLTVVNEQALKSLGVSPIGIAEVMTPSGKAQQYLYPAELVFAGTQIPKAVLARVAGSPHLQAQNLLALIGRDVLQFGVLIYNGSAGMFTLTF